MPRAKTQEPEPNPTETNNTPDLFDPNGTTDALASVENAAEKLAEQEKIVEATQGDFVKCATALATIDTNELYRAAGDDSFAAYMGRRWSSIDERRLAIIGLRQLGQSTRQIAEQVGVSHVQVHRDLAAASATVTPGNSSPMPTTVTGKDNKKRAATTTTKQQAPRQPQPIKKPAPAGKPNHPAPFSEPILEVIEGLLEGYNRVLDPFAGIGGIHALAEKGWDTVGIEIEPRWADQHPRNKVGNALDLSEFPNDSFDAIATSPTYGNRLADNYDASDPQARHSYTFDYGADLNPDNTGKMQWGDKYRAHHEKAWQEATRVLRPGGRFILNIKDHIRGGVWQDVTAWHIQELFDMCGLNVIAIRPVVTDGHPSGANADLRSPAELVIAFVKPVKNAGE